MSERDTHFIQGFAKLLFEQLTTNGDVWFDELDPYWQGNWQQIIAQRAYDLVMYSQQFMPGIENVPDIQSWDDIPEGYA